MPIDIYEYKYYDFPFHNLLDNLKKVYNDKEYYEYLNKWSLILNELENISQKDFENFVENVLNFDKAPETYCYFQPFSNYNSEYKYHFNIDRILLKVKKMPYQYQFTRKLKKIIDYDKTINLDSRQIKNSPIIICPFILPKSQFIVIDGNTRFNYNLMNHRILTKYIIYTPYSKDDFVLSIDWAMYHFINEINTIKSYNTLSEFTKNSIIFSDDFRKQINSLVSDKNSLNKIL